MHCQCRIDSAVGMDLNACSDKEKVLIVFLA